MRRSASATAVLLAMAIVVAVVQAPAALATKAPSAAVDLAVNAAQSRFHTTDVHADFSLRSRRDPRWALIDGFAGPKNRLWAAWLHQDRTRWTLRYLDVTAPFEPASTAHGRVPCDLYPAFSEAVCRPSGPTDAQIKTKMARQLVPTGANARIGALLTRGVYAFIFRPPVNGTLTISWRAAPASHTHNPTVLARGKAEFLNGQPGRIAIALTTAGRRALAKATCIKATASATLTPILYAKVTATRTFTLRR